MVQQVIRAVTTDWGAYVAQHARWFQRNGRWMQLTPEGVIGTVIFTFAIVVFGAVLWLVVARSVLRGRGWARVVVAASAVLGVVTAPSLFATPDGLGVAWGVVGLIASVASAVLLWLPSSRRFFAAAKAERRRFKAERIR
ncbi:hypothetical protein A0130_03020 [Leifsonia xyli]|nr:hypothetical protein A0130_03020 [Leifsonia xyli]